MTAKSNPAIHSLKLKQNQTDSAIPTQSYTHSHWTMTATNIFAVLSLFFLPISTSALYLCLGCVVVFSLLAGQLKQNIAKSFLNPVALSCIGLFGLFIVGCLYSSGSTKDIFQGLSKLSKLLYVPFLLPVFSEKKWRDRAIIAFVLAMFLSLVLGLLKLNLILPSILFLRHSSPATVFKSYIDTNLMMAFAVFILAQVMVTANLSKIVKAGLFLVTVGMTIYVLWWSEGRAGYFVFMALWVLFCLQHLSFRKTMFGIAVLTLLLSTAAMFSNTFRERVVMIPKQIQQYKEGNQFTSIGQRLQYYQNTFSLALKRPWFGWGTGSLKNVYEEYAKQNNLFKTQNPHNEYLNIFFQLGILGLVGFISFLAFLCYFSFRLPIFEGYILQGSCLAMALGCLGNSWLMDFTSGFWFIIMVALCASAAFNKLSIGNSG